MRASLVILLTIAVGACTGCAKSPTKPAHRFKVDTHVHVGPDGIANLIALMDAHGIDVAVNLSGGSPGRGLEIQVEAARKTNGRVVVFANLDWRRPRMGPGYGADMAASIYKAKELGAIGLKIPKGLGIGFTDYTGQLIPVDSPELDAVFDACGAVGFPIAIHVGDPKAFWRPPTPDNERYDELGVHPEWSFYQGPSGPSSGEAGRASRAPVPSWEELAAALERRIARHPKTTFISVHFGNDPEDPAHVAALLDRYPNMYVDTAARVPEIGRYDAAKLRKIFVDHADRILFGTDLGVGPDPRDLMLGSTGKDPPGPAEVERFFASTWRFFETSDKQFDHPTPVQGRWKIDGIGLDDATLRKVYGENAARLLGLKAP